ncbi:MAG: hypothetical protein JW749_00770 [Sedimentisphaerales bacterium]|nr:hypothetical protein [Sedimentisphaerales bacterium]
MLATNVCPAGHTQSILLTGYWPPTNEMLRKFSTNPAQNPGGWQGQNWEGRGYDVYAFFPEFPGGTGSNPKGDGDFEVDYQDVASWQPPAEPTGDFWRITGEIHPVAIMSFGQGAGPWEIEYNARNLPSSSWSSDYLSPTKPTPAPPDTTQASGYVRHSSLPVEAIAEAVNSAGLGINAWVDWDKDPGHFLCEYMAYHDGWYQSIHGDPCDQYYCVGAGFTHIASGVSPANGTAGVEAALRALISQLDLELFQYTVSGTVTAGGSALAGVTMCGLPGNPVTNGSGQYSAYVGGGWSGTVTPLKSGYAFTQRSYANVRTNQTAQDYTGSVVTAETIAFDAASSEGSSSASSTLSWQHTVGSGNNRILVVGIVAEDSVAADEIISSVKFNGVNMTPVPGSTKSRTVYSGSSYSRTLRAALYYMLNPPVGSYTVLITYNGSVTSRIGGAVSLRNVKQQAPEAAAANAATATSVSTSITVPNEGAWIIDVVGHSNSGSFSSSTTTERWDRSTSNHTGACGTKAVTTPGLNSVSWTYSGSSGAMVHSIAVFAPSESAVVPPTRTLSVSSSTGGTVTTPGIGNFDYTDGSNASIIASANPNYHFVNWTGSAVTAGKVANPNASSTTVLMDANYAVQANFAVNTRSLTTSATAGGTVTTPGIGTYWYNQGSTNPIVANAYTCNHFVNWTGTAVTAGKVNNPNAASTTVTVDANYTVQANFAIDTFTLTYNAGTGGTISGTTPQTVNCGDDGSPVTAVPNACYHFVNWSDGSTDNPRTDLNVTADITVTANFTIDTFTVTASAGPNGSVAPPSVVVNCGGDQMFTADHDNGYEVDTWYLDGNPVQTGGNTYTLSNITANHTVNVTFKIKTFSITASAGPHGFVAPTSAVVDYNGSQCFTASPDTGYEIDKWYLDGNEVQTGGGYCLFNITANHTVNVTFKIMTFTVSGTAGENGSIAPTSADVNYGGSQMFTATPDTGYEVDKWQVDSVDVQTGGLTYNLTNVTAANTISVTFKILRFSISGYVIEPDEVTAVEGVVIHTDDVNLMTDVNGFYEFTVDYGWSGTVTPQKDGYTFEPNAITYTNITQDYNDANYTAWLNTYAITGYVLEPDYSTPISDVNVSAEYGGGAWTSKYGGGVCLTDADGFYEVLVDYNWSGSVTPAKYAYAFEPNSIFYQDVNENYENQDYTGTLLTYRITGWIRNECNVPISGVLVSADNGGGQSISDVNGFYEVWVDYNWSGAVTPSKSHYIFDPGQIGYVDVLADRVNQNYVAYNVYDLDCDGSIGFGDVDVIADNWLLAGPEGDFTADGTVNFLDFAEFGIVWGNE